ncbi:MAG TPA: GAF domain-containing protein [Bacteroidales bacterium]|nr:GAF domain-containing protein [Bacteroidales bacterium]
MKLRLTISAKIILGFGVLIIACLLNMWFFYNVLQKNQEQNKKFEELYDPSISNFEQLQNQVYAARLLIKNWVYIESETVTPDKLSLMDIMELKIPYLTDKLIKLSPQWPRTDQIIYNDIQILLNDSLALLYTFVSKTFNSPEAYQLKNEKVLLKPDFNKTLDRICDKINTKTTILLKNQQERSNSLKASLNATYTHTRSMILFSTIVLILIGLGISIYTIHSLIGPINYIKKILFKMGKGILPAEKLRERNDEIGEMAVALNSLVRGLKEISNFSIEIGKGNFNSNFTPLSDDDILGNSLIKMREELSNAALEEVKRKKEDEHRNWTTQGIAKFSEILRQNSSDLQELSNNIISNLVNYLGANQGGIFIVNDSSLEGITIDMTGCYAYNRQKFLKREFKPGEGLIGRCYLERETIFLTEIPKDYIKITSGMGEDNPTCLIVVPLLYNDKVFGVIEIASFNIFEQFQIDFVEKIASSIASTISVVKINIQTNKLLEQSRQQAEEMASQEEEMRQNMEELRATQEESARKEAALLKELKELKKRMEKYEL